MTASRQIFPALQVLIRRGHLDMPVVGVARPLESRSAQSTSQGQLGSSAPLGIDALSARLQEEGALSFVQSWDELMESIVSRSDALKTAG